MKKTMDVSKNVLVFAPHHDDESIGCGGQISIHALQGDNVQLAVVTKGTMGVPDKTGPEAMQIREQEARVAAKILGIKRILFMRLQDHALEFNATNRDRFIETIRQTQPDLIYLPHSDESDRDHRITCEIGKEATWLAKEASIRTHKKHLEKTPQLRYYEVWTPIAKPHISVDIDSVWHIKEAAIASYRSQISETDYIQMAKGLNMYRAIQRHTRAKLAECFDI